jgi:hypothetical protein
VAPVENVSAVLKASPAIYFVNNYKSKARRAHLQYRTNVYRG